MFIDLDLVADYLVFLDNKWIRSAVAANEEEGWVDILDLANMAPLDIEIREEHFNPDNDEIPEIREEFPTIRKFGRVVVKKKPQ